MNNNCLCNLFSSDNILWLVIIAALLIYFCGCGNNGTAYNGGCGCGCGC